MCTNGDGMPGDVAEALRNISMALDHLNGPAGVAVLEAAGRRPFAFDRGHDDSLPRVVNESPHAHAVR